MDWSSQIASNCVSSGNFWSDFAFTFDFFDIINKKYDKGVWPPLNAAWELWSQHTLDASWIAFTPAFRAVDLWSEAAGNKLQSFVYLVLLAIRTVCGICCYTWCCVWAGCVFNDVLTNHHWAPQWISGWTRKLLNWMMGWAFSCPRSLQSLYTWSGITAKSLPRW